MKTVDNADPTGTAWLRRAAWLLGAACLTAAAAEPPAPEAAVFAHPASAEQLATLLGPAARDPKAAAALRGSFTQQKFLKELPNPLTSSGDFFVARGLGVDWHTLKPFDATVVLTPQALIQRSGNGPAQRVAADQQPGLRAVGQVFDALFTLDLAQLGETFMLFGAPGDKPGSWTLGLKPREPAFAKVMDHILITGSTQPNQILLYEGGGDHTEIDFGKVTALKDIDDADRRRFMP